jgi:ATP-dependent DNA helicase RecG
MNQAEIQKIIQSGESERVEFKQSFSEELIETIVAFSNSSGGTIFVGINNQGEIIGIQIGKETLQKWTNEIKNKTSPSQIVDISEIEIEAKTIC